MIDYEIVKKHFADKLAADFAGQGRFESAFYHTIKMVHDTVSAESADRIALMESDIKSLCAALSTACRGKAQLLDHNAQLLAENERLLDHIAGMRDVLADEARA